MNSVLFVPLQPCAYFFFDFCSSALYALNYNSPKFEASNVTIHCSQRKCYNTSAYSRFIESVKQLYQRPRKFSHLAFDKQNLHLHSFILNTGTNEGTISTTGNA